MLKEYLVTAQGYEKTDQYKQTILLHDTFMAKDDIDATEMFKTKFENEYKIIKVYSTQDITTNR